MEKYVFIIDLKPGPKDLFNFNLEEGTLEYFPGKTVRIDVYNGKVYLFNNPTDEEVDAMPDDEYMSFCVARLKYYETYASDCPFKHWYPRRMTKEQRQAYLEREREREPQRRQERERDRQEELRLYREAGIDPYWCDRYY